MYCVTLRLHDIKKLTLVSLEYAMEVPLADASVNQVSAENIGIKVSALITPN